MKNSVLCLCCLFSSVWLVGCASNVPTIAHTHIGHALVGWHDTPEQDGLFITAEREAELALKAAENAARPGAALADIKAQLDAAAVATVGKEAPPGGTPEYGVKNALTLASSHIGYAAESGDVSGNVKRSAEAFSGKAIAVIQRCDLIAALVQDVRTSESQEVASLLAEEVVKLAQANVNGVDIDNDGVIGNRLDEYGIKQLRAELEAMIAAEESYTPVERWYLFNLVRLPGGEWIFRRMRQGGAGGAYGGG